MTRVTFESANLPHTEITAICADRGPVTRATAVQGSLEQLNSQSRGIPVNKDRTLVEHTNGLEESRREFLKSAGKLAIYAPPAMIALMQPSREAVARSATGERPVAKQHPEDTPKLDPYTHPDHEGPGRGRGRGYSRDYNSRARHRGHRIGHWNHETRRF